MVPRRFSREQWQKWIKPQPLAKQAQELARWKLQNQRLTEKLRQAELIIDIQKKSPR